MSYKPVADQRPDRYKVSTAEYAQYQKQGFLVVESLVDLDEVEELKAHVMAMLKGQIDVPGQEPPSPEATEEELVERFTRVHQLHRWDATCERFLLHPARLGRFRGAYRAGCAGLADHAVFQCAGHGRTGLAPRFLLYHDVPGYPHWRLVGLGAGRRGERLPVGRARL